MSSGPFRQGLARLEQQLAGLKTTAIMCAETAWVRCHRRFIAQELVARGYRVTHILLPDSPTRLSAAVQSLSKPT